MCNGLDCTQTKKHWKSLYLKEKPMFSAVGMTGLEPATSRPPDACANQLRYIPLFL